jgi:hypothetical protein
MKKLLIFLAVSWMGIGLGSACTSIQNETPSNFTWMIIGLACLGNLFFGFYLKIVEDTSFPYQKLFVGLFVNFFLLILAGMASRSHLLIFYENDFVIIPLISIYAFFVAGHFLSTRTPRKDE